MKKIKSNKTTPELFLQKALRKEGFKFRKNYKKLYGNPDLALIEEKIAVFVDGEFWHGYSWEEKKKRIKTNRSYWIPKIEKTIQRDKQNNRKLRKDGWKVIRFWERQIKKDLEKCINKIKKTTKIN